MNFDSPLYADYKNEVQPIVTAQKEKLENWDFGFDKGNEKVNGCPGNYCEFTWGYMESHFKPENGYARVCAMEKFCSDILVEALPHQFPHYLRFWLGPEIWRAFFLNHSTAFNSFRYFTQREFGTNKSYAKEFETPVYYFLTNEESRLYRIALYVYELILPNKHSVFSLLFFGYLFVVFPKLIISASRDRKFWLQILLVLHLAGYLLLVGGLVWFYERYTMYVVFPIVLLGSMFVNQIIVNLPIVKWKEKALP
jgi:hypothetical protein